MTNNINIKLQNIKKLPGRVQGLESSVSALHDKNEQLRSLISDLNQRVVSSRQFVPTLYVADHMVLAKLFTDLKIYLDPRDMAVAAHISLDGIWEKEITRAWLTVLEPKMTILDIGANFGYFGLLSGQFTDRKNAKIIQFEANPNIIPYVNKSISINWLNETVKVENLAVSDKEGTVTLTVLKDYIGSSSVQSFEKLDSYMHDKMQLDVNETIDVKAITIDKYCKDEGIKNIDLIKMDIEGHEEAAYSGMRGMIKNSPNVTMFIEFTKDGYTDPLKFYDTMLKDFGNVYTIDDKGNICPVKDASYQSVIDKDENWTMPIFSKNDKLHLKKNLIIG